MEAPCVPILGILGHMVVNWDTLKHSNFWHFFWLEFLAGNFWLENLLIR